MSTTTQINQEGINVLSLFDGISCAKLALEKAGIKINKYYSSEICPHALAIQNHHYSGDTNHIQLGDVCKIDGIELREEIDLIIFGSPCTQLSSVNSKDRNGLEEYKMKRNMMANQRQELNNVKQEINNIKNDMQDIKNLLLQLMEKNSNG